MNHKDILIIEDDKAIVRILELELKYEGYSFDIAYDGNVITSYSIHYTKLYESSCRYCTHSSVVFDINEYSKSAELRYHLLTPNIFFSSFYLLSFLF